MIGILYSPWCCELASTWFGVVGIHGESNCASINTCKYLVKILEEGSQQTYSFFCSMNPPV